uniref:Uncharacterized protein n=1 Tax=Anguilla anguilla TaxID=7936 RepID=A0A0E9UX39_ANGAN
MFILFYSDFIAGQEKMTPHLLFPFTVWSNLVSKREL